MTKSSGCYTKTIYTLLGGKDYREHFEMLTYLLHERVFRADESKKLEFPNTLIVTAKLAPSTVFGAGDEYSRLVVYQSKANLIWNSNTGRVQCKSDPPLSPLEVIVEGPDTKFSLLGDTLNYTCHCKNLEQLAGCLQGLQFVFPAFLNLKFPDPPVVEHIKGKLGKVDFRWEHSGMIYSFTPQTEEILEKHVAEFINLLPLFSGIRNRRLIAAIYYFYTSSRLLVSGHGQWEFMAECILNLCKALEILFGSQMDSIRIGLAKLEYKEEEVEGDFIPLVILRNVLDVAHPRIAIFPQESLSVLYVYLSNTETRFRTLLEKVIKAVGDGILELEQDGSLELNESEKTKLEKLITTLRNRNPLSNK